jgi:hypothetical protein
MPETGHKHPGQQVNPVRRFKGRQVDPAMVWLNISE